MKPVGGTRWGVIMQMFNSREAISFRSVLNCFEYVFIGIFWINLL